MGQQPQQQMQQQRVWQNDTAGNSSAFMGEGMGDTSSVVPAQPQQMQQQQQQAMPQAVQQPPPLQQQQPGGQGVSATAAPSNQTNASATVANAAPGAGGPGGGGVSDAVWLRVSDTSSGYQPQSCRTRTFSSPCFSLLPIPSLSSHLTPLILLVPGCHRRDQDDESFMRCPHFLIDSI